jgi:hypothetical protein
LARHRRHTDNRVKKSRTRVVTEYTETGKPKPKLYPLKIDFVNDSDHDVYIPPEPNIPTVDELVEIGMNKKYAAQLEAAKADLEAKIAEAKEKAYQEALYTPIKLPGSQTATGTEAIMADAQAKIARAMAMEPFKKSASNNRPKIEADPEPERGARKIVLE